MIKPCNGICLKKCPVITHTEQFAQLSLAVVWKSKHRAVNTNTQKHTQTHARTHTHTHTHTHTKRFLSTLLLRFLCHLSLYLSIWCHVHDPCLQTAPQHSLSPSIRCSINTSTAAQLSPTAGIHP